MSQPVYRIQHPNGSRVEVALQPKQIAARFPGARITHRIKFDEAGRGVPIPYDGAQPELPEGAELDKDGETLTVNQEADARNAPGTQENALTGVVTVRNESESIDDDSDAQGVGNDGSDGDGEKKRNAKK